MELTPVMLSRAALLRARLTGLRAHLPGEHDQDDHAGVDAGEFVPGLDFLATKRAGGHYVALFVDNDGNYGTQVEGARYVAVRMHEGGQKTWDEDELGASLVVGVDELDAVSDSMNQVAGMANSYVDPHGDPRGEFDDDNRPAEYEDGPFAVAGDSVGRFELKAYHDRYGDRGSEGSRFIVVADETQPDPTWDDNVTIIDARKVKFVADGMKSVRDEVPINDWREQGRDDHGRFTSGVPSITTGVEDLVEIVDEIERRGVPGDKMYGGQSSETMIFRLEDGRKIVRKRAPAWGDPADAKADADAEQLGGLVATVLDAPVARSYRADRTTVYIEHLDGHTNDWASEIEYRSNRAKRLALLDVLIGNPDRNEGNLMWTDDGLKGIDQGGSWMGARALAMGGEMADNYGTPLASLGPLGGNIRPNTVFATSEGPGLGRWIDNPLSPDDVIETRVRLESMRVLFKDAGREDWLNFSLRTLDEIAPHAKGTGRIYDD